jgi:hypothetical protein
MSDVLFSNCCNIVTSIPVSAIVHSPPRESRESIRKTIATLAMIFDYAKVDPNPARDRTTVLPREDKAELNPPAAEHILAAHPLLALRDGDVAQARLRAALSQRPEECVVAVTEDPYIRVGSDSTVDTRVAIDG